MQTPRARKKQVAKQKQKPRPEMTLPATLAVKTIPAALMVSPGARGGGATEAAAAAAAAAAAGGSTCSGQH
jgi:hypothetical protein